MIIIRFDYIRPLVAHDRDCGAPGIATNASSLCLFPINPVAATSLWPADTTSGTSRNSGSRSVGLEAAQRGPFDVFPVQYRPTRTFR